MKNLILLLSVSLVFNLSARAQTTAMDFNMNDCNGQMHNLFSELNQGDVVILEFFMLSCSPCITAGQKLEALHQTLVSQFGSKVRYYQFGYNNSYTCAQVKNWVTSNGFSSVPFDSGAAQVAYYGGMGMPTVAVVAGSSHDVLFSKVGFSTSDTTIIGSEVRNFFNITSVRTLSTRPSLKVYPNPASGKINISLNTNAAHDVKLELLNIAGQKAGELIRTSRETNILEGSFLTENLPDGIYFIKGQLNGEMFTEKVAVLH